MASTQLQRTAVTSTENYKYTFSAWVKRTGVLGSSSVNEVLFSNWNDSSNSAYIRFEDINDNLQVYDQYNEGPDLNYQTNMKFRDPNSWYHIVVNVDSTRSANTRCKIYVNGSEVSCSNTTDTGGTLAMKTVTTTNAMRLGAIRTASGAEYYFSGLMSHVHYIDGTGYDASYFGETDSTTGEWKIKTNVTGVTYGNNGFFILKDGTNLSGSTVQDQSGNSNNFSVSAGTLTKTEDNPSNVFATINPLDNATTGTQTYSNGNTTMLTDKQSRTTLGASSGKWYCEAKYVNNTAFNGIAQMDGSNTFNTNSIILFGNNNGEIFVSGSSTDTNVGAGTAIDNNSIIMFAMDLDNNRLYIGKNGSWWTSGAGFNSASLSSYKTITRVTGDSFGFKCSSGSGTSTTSWNFGNGYFGTTAVASAGTNASGIGIFEYDVPANFTSLSTKGLNL
jgi:hypothetical protein